MAREEILELLGKVPIFGDLEPEHLERVADLVVPRRLSKDTRVFHEGDLSDSCYLVRGGELRVTREHPDGRAIALASLFPGDIFGELAMLDGEARSASVETVADSELLAIASADMHGLMREHPEITVRLVRALTRRLREANERISRQSFQTVPSRVAGVLSQLVAEAGLEGRDSITVRMTQTDLAKLAGTSRESVSRFLATLDRAGIVRVGRGRVTIIKPQRLRAYIF